MVDESLWFIEHGTLPVAGGLLDQPPRFVECVSVVRGVIAAMRDEAKPKKPKG